MRVLCCSLALTTAGVALLALSGTALAQSTEPNHCTKTADFALQACRNDAQAEYRNTIAVCRNIGSAGERNTCREEAETALEEALRAGDESCEAQREARTEVCAALGEERYDPDWDPENFVDPDEIGGTVAANPYLSLVPGTTQIIRAGEALEEWVIQYVTTDTEEVDGVICRTVVDLEFAPDEPDDEEELPEPGGFDRQNDIIVDGVALEIVEYTDDWYAQDVDGNLWYCGELSREFENGDIASLDGSFKAGEDGDKAGVLIPAMPMVDDVYRQEWSVNNAEDWSRVISTAGGPDVEVEGFECNGSCLVTEEGTPLEPGDFERKYWLAETGFVLAEDVVEEGEAAEREELICLGAALEDCVTDPDILDELCKIAPDAFCDEDITPPAL